ncbi:MAG TPA: ABC transporter ATP-binding protein [Candidatus Xenobia bacterium]|nr:ABC transporter ATP-binding protein [Candidatus Xenobia bacterium]
MAAAVTLENLGKDFPVVGRGLDALRLPFARPTKRALDAVTLSVETGEVFGLLGPNGAGKTTLLKILCTLLEPNRGRALLFGHDVVRGSAAVRRHLGYCPGQERSFYLRLSARENLRFYGTLNNLPPVRLAARIEAVLEELGLAAAADEPVRNYSTGMLQRLALARALLHEPRVLVFDEPTRSLDPAGAAWWRSYVRQELAQRRGCTLLVATHNLAEAEEVCDRLAVIHRGRLQALGTPAGISREAGAASLGEAYQRLTQDVPAEVASLP